MKRNNKYKYEVGEVVNDTLRIVSQTRHSKRNEKAYEVRSLVYPDAPTYIVKEKGLDAGNRCAYRNGTKIYEGNSLYSIEWLRPYLIDIEEAKTIGFGSRQEIMFRCPYCYSTKKHKPNTLTSTSNNNYPCRNCSKGTSYPELFMLAYLEVKGIEYEYQKVFEDLKGRSFDFFIYNKGLVEVHGGFHYKETNFKTFTKTTQSDKEKQEYCKKHNIPYIEIDARESTFKFIKESINQSILPSIRKEEAQLILNHIEKNKRYPVKEIVKLYTEGKSTIELGHMFDISHETIRNILQKSNIFITGNKRLVRCTTGEVFNSIKEAADWVGLKSPSSLNVSLKKACRYAGKHPITGVPLQWEYVE